MVVLLSPVCCAVAGWFGRRRRRLAERLRERRREADLPRRMSALHHTGLQRLPPDVVTELARHARWVHPRQGEQLLTAGAAVTDVHAVADGAVEARRPGDPPGTIRARAAPGELIGVAPVLSGASSAHTWTTVGTRLLVIPASVFARVVGPLVKPPPAERAEAETLLAESSALAGLSEEDRLALLGNMRAVDVAPGEQVTVRESDRAAVISSGTVESVDGSRIGRGALIGPPTGDEPVRAEARSRARLWTLPVPMGLARLLSADSPPVAAGSGPAPSSGLHSAGSYPPLSPPPGPPPPGDDEADRRLPRRFVVLLVLVLFFALLSGAAAARDPIAWAEMPNDRVLLTVEQGTVTALIDGERRRLDDGSQRHLTAGDTVEVARRSLAKLTYRGGGYARLCPLTFAGVRDVSTERDGATLVPSGTLRLARGTLLADTYPDTHAIRRLTLSLDVGEHPTANRGGAEFGVVAAPAPDAQVRRGPVTFDGALVAPTGRLPGCGDVAAEPAGRPSSPGVPGAPGSAPPPAGRAYPTGRDAAGRDATGWAGSAG